MFRNKIVLHFIDGRIKKGVTSNFDPGREIFHLAVLEAPPDVRPLEIHVDELKAVFFVKSFEGDSLYHDQEDFGACKKTLGRKVRIRFKDGEVLAGVTGGYAPEKAGFFITPADPQSNIERCFVVKEATVSIEFL